MFINKGVAGGPFGPSREGPGVRQKMASDTKQMIKGRKKRKKEGGKGKKSKREEGKEGKRKKGKRKNVKIKREEGK